MLFSKQEFFFKKAKSISFNKKKRRKTMFEKQTGGSL